MTYQKNLVLVGIISSVHGIKGDVIVKSFTMPVTNITQMSLVNEQGEDITLKLIRQKFSGELICKFNKINNRTEAEKFKFYKLFCLRANFPQPDEDEFYIEDLKKLVVLDKNSQSLGKISNIFNFGAGDIIEIEFNNKVENKVELFPFNKEFFPVITKDYLILNRD